MVDDDTWTRLQKACSEVMEALENSWTTNEFENIRVWPFVRLDFFLRKSGELVFNEMAIGGASFFSRNERIRSLIPSIAASIIGDIEYMVMR